MQWDIDAELKNVSQRFPYSFLVTGSERRERLKGQISFQFQPTLVLMFLYSGGRCDMLNSLPSLDGRLEVIDFAWFRL